MYLIVSNKPSRVVLNSCKTKQQADHIVETMKYSGWDDATIEFKDSTLREDVRYIDVIGHDTVDQTIKEYGGLSGCSENLEDLLEEIEGRDQPATVYKITIEKV